MKKSKVATLRVPARLYDSALRFVNRRRKEKKLAPLKRLPAGRQGDANSCPCASKCGAAISVGGGNWNWDDGTCENHMDGPSDFVNFFDGAVHRDSMALPVRGTSRKAKP